MMTNYDDFINKTLQARNDKNECVGPSLTVSPRVSLFDEDLSISGHRLPEGSKVKLITR